MTLWVTIVVVALILAWRVPSLWHRMKGRL
jgi:hypothetical protein